MSNIFQQIAGRKPRTNTFDLSHERKMSINMGQLIPILCEEVIPGDKFNVNSEILIRLAPLKSPMMHRVSVYTHYFFVPNRIIYNEWEEFITGGEDGTLMPSFPKLLMNEQTKHLFYKYRLSDYLGIPTMTDETVTQSNEISALPFRAYTEIYNEYYRDQNVTEKVDFEKGGTVQNHELITRIRNRAWEKDYFTSALPWAQRGGEVGLPIESQFAPDYIQVSNVYDQAGQAQVGDLDVSPVGQLSSTGGASRIENLRNPQEVDSTSVTINELRKAIKLQEWLEKNARGGSRYIEQIKSHFGITSSDARLQRPEYLGGGRNPIVISEVLSTYGGALEGQPEVPQGHMAGHGISVGKTHNFKKRFEEHGYILGIMSVLPRTAYQQGIERTYKKFDKLDYYWPEFAQLGEQEIKDSELFYDQQGAPDEEDGTFGYQSRYAEYKYKQSTVHGDFRDNLKYWHMGREFDSKPNLNTAFVESNPTHRVFAVTDEQISKLYVQIYNKVLANRPIPQFNVPTI